jgi:hypothetical protein
MCSRPIEQDGFTFACRSCDECIATRRHGWVARAMMEMETAPETIVLTLTYNDETQENRDASRVFAYCDVSAFFKRVRSALNYQYPDESPWLRFLVAGEQGDRNNRCHWHCVVYSSHPLPLVGTFTGFKPGIDGKVELTWPDDSKAMLTTGKGRHERRLDWDIWGKGFVTLQEASQAAMSYVLSYCLKDQFTEEKSRGTRRYMKSENFATGLFRMSKRPSIGERFLFQRLAEFAEMGQCPPSVSLKVPGFKGYYSPSGLMRERMLWGLVALKQRVLYTTGRNPPQWSSLLASCAEFENDLEVLLDVPKENPEEAESVEAEFARKGREVAGGQQAFQDRARCGRGVPCWECLNGFDDEQLHAVRLERFQGEVFGETSYRAYEGEISYYDRKSDYSKGCNPFCLLRGTKRLRQAFLATGGG